MRHKFFISIAFVSVLINVLLTGCGDSGSPPRRNSDDSAVLATGGPRSKGGDRLAILQIHWLGKNGLALQGNATNFVALWNLPESVRLETQTLDKLATAPWRLWAPTAALSPAASSQFRLLLNDLLQEESYLEAQGGTNQPVEWVWALRLPPAQVAFWQTNLPLVLQSIFPQSEVLNLATGFSFWTADFRLDLSRAGEWTLLSFLGQGGKPSAPSFQSDNLVTAFQGRIASQQAPFLRSASNYWFEVSLDMLQANRVLHFTQDPMTNLPLVALRLWGDGQNVQTAAELVFPRRLDTNLPAWSIPTNLVVDPLVGLTLLRSIGPVLRDVNLISPERAGLIPPQILSWQRAGPPLQVHFAAPALPATGLFVKTYLPACLEWVNAHLETAKFGQIITNQSFGDYRWQGLSLAVPSFCLVTNRDASFYHLGLGLLPPRPQPLAPELRDFATADAATVFFEWEYTAETVSNWRYLDDISRMIFDTAHVPRLHSGLATIEWLKSNRTNLSHTVSRWRFENPNTLAFKRKSTLGLNGLELAILTYWLEQPEFPAGLHTLWQTNSTPYKSRRLR